MPDTTETADLSLADQLQTLRQGCGLLRHPALDALEMSGEDRSRFLNGRVTCDVKPLEPGQGVYGFVTSAKGRVLADLGVLALADRFWLVLPPGTGAETRAQFEKFILADRVEIRPLEGWRAVMLAGPAAPRLLESLGALPERTFHHAETELAGQNVRIVRERDLGFPVFTLWLPGTGADAVLTALRERGVAEVGFEAWETVRIEAGQPRFGADFGPDCFPQETGLETLAVSYTKGCYLGQEVVARIHYRGGVQRELRGLLFSPDAAAEPGRALLQEGREVGKIGSATHSPRAGCQIGLAVVHQRAATGTTVEVEGGGYATLKDLPFSFADG
ncbi:MAG: aminomethyl transferase family protein [Thermoanaerobaculia bacterium]|nr:aminomethyl transferase family protein [Thermoanaerobaculia bacterium]